MQTFLPFPNFAVSAYFLDRQRLGKQRIEAYMATHYLVTAIEDGWGQHPVVAMWRGHLPALSLYLSIVDREWRRRGYESKMIEPFDADYRRDDAFYAARHLPEYADHSTIVFPQWLGDPAFHAAHRSQLLAKSPEWYGRLGWTEKPGALPYVWPAGEGDPDMNSRLDESWQWKDEK